MVQVQKFSRRNFKILCAPLCPHMWTFQIENFGAPRPRVRSNYLRLYVAIGFAGFLSGIEGSQPVSFFG
jgi:hypothetical protein